MSQSLSIPAPTREEVRGLRAILSYQAAHVKSLEQENRQLREPLEDQGGDPQSASDSTTGAKENEEKDLEQIITGAVLHALELYGARD